MKTNKFYIMSFEVIVPKTAKNEIDKKLDNNLVSRLNERIKKLKEFPDRNELVIGTVSRVNPYSAYISLEDQQVVLNFFYQGRHLFHREYKSDMVYTPVLRKLMTAQRLSARLR